MAIFSSVASRFKQRARISPNNDRPIRSRGPGRKEKSLGYVADTTTDGVYVSTRGLPDKNEETKESFGSGSPSISSTASWKSAGSEKHHTNSPLIVAEPEKGGEIKDELEALGQMMARSRQLPSTWYYSSNHILVNQERSKRYVAPLVRMHELDAISRRHAEAMAAEGQLFHIDPISLQASLNKPARRLGANVAKGESIRDMHRAMMQTLSDKNNILDRRYTNMGMATARGASGEIYMCQIFRG